MKEYLSSCEEVLKEQNSSEQGLSTGEAQQRLSRFGKNELEKGKKTSLLKRFLGELADPMIIILIVAAAISGITAFYEGESFADVIIILAVVILMQYWVLSRKVRQKLQLRLYRKSQPLPARYSVTEK